MPSASWPHLTIHTMPKYTRILLSVIHCQIGVGFWQTLTWYAKSSRLLFVLCSSIQYTNNPRRELWQNKLTHHCCKEVQCSYLPWLQLPHHQQQYGWSWTLKNICSRENNTHTLKPTLSHLRTPVHKHTSHMDICDRKRHIIMSVLFKLSTHTGWVGFSSVGHQWAMLIYNNVQPSFLLQSYQSTWNTLVLGLEKNPVLSHLWWNMRKKIFVHKTVGLIQ